MMQWDFLLFCRSNGVRLLCIDTGRCHGKSMVEENRTLSWKKWPMPIQPCYANAKSIISFPIMNKPKEEGEESGPSHMQNKAIAKIWRVLWWFWFYYFHLLQECNWIFFYHFSVNVFLILIALQKKLYWLYFVLIDRFLSLIIIVLQEFSYQVFFECLALSIFIPPHFGSWSKQLFKKM